MVNLDRFEKDTWNFLNELVTFSDTSFKNNQSYPPHNIYVKTDADNNKKLVLEFALAGFDKKDITIDIKEGNLLTVAGKDSSDGNRDSVKFIKKCMAKRSFKNTYAIANDFLSDPDAEFDNGMLRISFDAVEEERKVVNIK